MKQLILRADATPSMGTGHVMRCLALAQMAKKFGYLPCLVSRLHVPWVIKHLEHTNLKQFFITDKLLDNEDPNKLLHQLDNAIKNEIHVNQRWIVLDGYHFNLECHNVVRNAGYKLLVIDDYMHLSSYNCDILLNQNICAENLKYKGNITYTLLGLKYALLRHEFIETLRFKTEIKKYVKNILISFGGGDFIDYLIAIADALKLEELKNINIVIIAGSMSPEKIEKILVNSKCKIMILKHVQDMASLLKEIDLAITAGGSTCWELACFGIPFLTIEVAKNQHEICHWLDIQKYAPYFSISKFKLMLQDNTLRLNIKNKLKSLVDGNGASRILTIMNNNKF